jgi:uncharacterized ion transporter superfamily protein YfcC
MEDPGSHDPPRTVTVEPSPPEHVPVGGGADAAEPEPDAPAVSGKRGFPHPLTILTAVLVLVWIATLFIPSGEYQIGEDGRPIPGSFQEIDSPLDGSERVEDLLLSPVNGMYGIRDPETGQVGPFNSGSLFGGAQVFLFILGIGGFMTVVFATGALNLGIAHLAHRFATRGAVLIIGLSLLFGFLGSVMSWSDETLGMYPLLIPLMLALGYDRMVAFAVVWIAPAAGIIGSTVNPFKIGIGSDAADVSLGDGIGLRLVIFVLVMAAMIIYTLRYAAKVKADPSASIVGISADDAELARAGASDDLEPLSTRHKIVVAIVAFTFLLLTFSIIPWGSILHNTVVDPITHETVTEAFTWELGWWLPELTVLFIIMAIVVGAVAGLGEAKTVRAFVRGVVDFTGAAILVVVARGVNVVLNNSKTIDTVLNSMEELVDGTSNVVFVFVLSLVTLPITFLVGAASAGNALVMPLLAPLGDFSGVDRSLIVTIFNAIGAWFGNILPTSALLMAGLGIAKVGFNHYIKFLLPLWLIWLILQLAVFVPAAAL